MIGTNILKFNTIDSTNDYIKNHLNQFANGDIVWSLIQTKGRGRFGNSWMSLEGNLYFSVLLKNYKYTNNIFILHMIISVTIIRLLKKYGLDAFIKYPNDIIVNSKKIAGILVETIGYFDNRDIIFGIGLNVNQNDFNTLNNLATSMCIETSKNMILEEVLYDFIKLFNEVSNLNNIREIYLNKSLILGKYIPYLNSRFYVKSIYDNGKILLINEEKELEVALSSISLSDIYNKLDNF